MGKGICKGGLRTCQPDGLFGPCEGQVVPAPTDDCHEGLDSDCNGKKCGDLVGSLAVGASQVMRPSVASWKDGRVFSAFPSGIEVQDGSSNGYCLFDQALGWVIAGHDPDQPIKINWVLCLEPSASLPAVYVSSVVATGPDEIAVIGWTNAAKGPTIRAAQHWYLPPPPTEPDVIVDTIPLEGFSNGFVLKLKVEGGVAHKLWLRSMAFDPIEGSTGSSLQMTSAAADSAGNIIVTGEYVGKNLRKDTLPVEDHALDTESFLAKLDGKTGEVLWLRGLSSKGYDRLDYPFVDASNNDEIHFVGHSGVYADGAPGSATMGAWTSKGMLPSELAFYGVLSPGGEPDTSRFIEAMGGGHRFLTGVVKMPDGSLRIGGQFSGQMVLGSLAVLSSNGGVGQDGFVAKLVPADQTGTPAWISYLQPGSVINNFAVFFSLLPGPSDHVFTVATVSEGWTLAPAVGAPQFNTSGGYGSALLRLDGDGRYVFVRSLDGSGEDQAGGVARTASGVAVVGSFTPPLIVGQKPLDAAPSQPSKWPVRSYFIAYDQ